MRHTRHPFTKLSVLLCTAVFCGSAPSRAQAESQVMTVLHTLTPYDADGSRSFQALETLSELSRAAGAEQRRLLEFLHATGSVDLWMIAKLQGDAPLLARLADYWGVETSALPDALRQALWPLRHSSHEAAVADALAALRLLSGGPAVPASGEGNRADLAFVHVAAERAAASEHPADALAELALDPCPAIESCGDVERHFDAPGRAAVQALRRAANALQRFEAQSDRDPLLAALSSHVKAQAKALRQVELAPSPRAPEVAECAGSRCGSTGTVDLVAFVTADSVRVGVVPHVRIGADGTLELDHSDHPLWPEAREVDLPEAYPGYLRHVDDLVRLFSELREASEATHVGVGAAPGTPAHVWGRVMLSARAAHFDGLAALGRGPDGNTRLTPVRIVTPFAADRLGAPELDVIVLHRGYSVKRGGPRERIERVPDGTGAYRFDVEGLEARTREPRTASTHLRFVPDVPAEPVLDTAFALAPADEALTVVLP